MECVESGVDIPFNELVLNDSNASETVAKPVADILALKDFGPFGAYGVQLKSDKLYPVVISHNLCDNYLFLQCDEILGAKAGEPDARHINREHVDFLFCISDIRSYKHRRNARNNNRNTWTVGSPCWAQYSLDRCWYRALIVGLICNHSAEVYFVDYGNSQTVSIDRLRPISANNLKPSSHAFLCVLHNVRPRDGSWQSSANLSALILEYLRQLPANSLLAKFQSCERGNFLYEVDLYVGDGNGVPVQHALQRLVDFERLEFVDLNLVLQTVKTSINGDNI